MSGEVQRRITPTVRSDVSDVGDVDGTNRPDKTGGVDTVAVGAHQADETDKFDGTKAGSPDEQVELQRKVGQRIKSGLGKIADPFIISTLINTTGTAILHFAAGMPVDPTAFLTFEVVGTTIGASYFPIKEHLLGRGQDDES